MAATFRSRAGLATDDDTKPRKDASTAFKVDRTLSCVDWFIYEPIETIKLFDNKNGGQVDPEQIHWDTIPLKWRADKPMRIQLPVIMVSVLPFQQVSHVITVPAPCTMKQILTSIYEFYQSPVEVSELDDLKSKTSGAVGSFNRELGCLAKGSRVWEMVREGKPVQRFDLLGSTKLFKEPEEGQRRCGLFCTGFVRFEGLSERKRDGTVRLRLGS
jgi:hypothetical protein